ncbi:MULTISPECIES: KUP/HAK/KT family potassium transporter [Duncaniella]|uniref:Probable potassium transport system protein Kup n=1 Tax=Duncaniella dubosii TaxID=2518971 RepID=A0A4P7W3P8_9BACT|nr:MULTISPECIES: KUP/HAK/KT family potassium transporter [Duncaniella]MCX4284623.1 KUP/HAK/KT family potassium transporter [Duncaniella dubosii]QCD42633.1 potassium transporter Kup [Duncaniella dubosii]HBN63218.1 potassium transporter Kup [Porphyromonadaceae bacterium]
MQTETTTSRQNQQVHRVTIAALLVAIGIVFGDIGTSPLYVMKAIMGVDRGYGPDYVIGAVSCVIWTLTLQTTLKYVVIALRADNKGEGGILALYSLIKGLKRKWIYILAAVGASALIADGVITPAMTVTSAIEGLRDLDPDAPVLPIVVLIISGIFLVQRLGTKAIGKFFGPFMLVWFLMLGILGLIHLSDHWAIMKAFNPLYAVRLLVDYPGWFMILGAVFLCTTGAEALYSDLGHCGRMNITYSWLFVKLMLILNYLGQGAWLISQATGYPENINPFYGVMPRWFLPAGIIISTGAAIIASQALLSGSFTIFSEAMSLDFWPRLRIKYPSTVKGQLYIPLVNCFLYVGCILTVVIFRTSGHMEAAYGLAITITMLMTTMLLALYLRHKGVKLWIVGVFTVVFTLIEGAFFVANMFKFTHGGWFTLLIAGLVCAVMLVWRKATRIRRKYIEYRSFDDYTDIIKDIKSDKEIPKYASNLVYMSRSDKACEVESKLIYSIINKQPKRADHYWILRVEFTDNPDTLEYERTVIVPNTITSFKFRIGFRIQPQLSVYLRQAIEDMVEDGLIDLTSDYPSLRSHGISGDFRFIIIHRVFSQSSQCNSRDRFLMNFHALLRKMELDAGNAFGFDTSNLKIETVPLIINTHTPRRIMRIQ